MNWWCTVLTVLFVGSVPRTDLDTFFTRAYHDARVLELATTGPVLILGGDHARIYRLGALHETIHMNFEHYHTLKSLSHIPLTLFLLLKDPHTIDEARLREFHAILVTLGAEDMVTASLDLLGAQTRSTHVLDEYVRAQRESLHTYIQQAVQSQYAQLHHVVARLTPSDMRDLRVIVMGPLQARDGHIVSQFFRQYLHLDETDRGRLLYAENMSDAEDALLLLGTILVDRHIGTQFFNNSRRLESDLLGCVHQRHTGTPLLRTRKCSRKRHTTMLSQCLPTLF